MHWLRTFQSDQNPVVRKTALIKIFEELVASSEDLCMFYFAMKRLGDAPSGVIEFCDRFKVRSHEKDWEELMAALGPDDHFLEEFLARIDRLTPLVASGLSREDMAPIFRKLTNALRGAAATRRMGDRAIIRGAYKVRHGLLIRDDGDTVVLDVTQPDTSRISVSEELAEDLATAVVFMRQATAVVVHVLFLTMHLAAQNRAYGLTDAGNAEVLATFKDKPPTFS